MLLSEEEKPEKDEKPEEGGGGDDGSKEYFVYCLRSTSGATYVGATVDVLRRLRQHNQEIKGGAHATSAKVNRGEVWEMMVYVSGFPTWNAALQLEWRWKQLSRKSKETVPWKKRMDALHVLLHKLDRPTTKAVPYTEWSTPPELHWHIEEAKQEYERWCAASI